MSELHSMPMFWAEFFSDTEHVSGEVAKAYLFLLGHAWLRGAELPDDDRVLSRLARVSPGRWSAIKAEVMGFWFQTEKGWSQKRLRKEWVYIFKTREVKRQLASLGGKASAAKKRHEINEGAQANAQANAQRTLNQPTPTPTIEELSNDSSIAQAAPAPRTRREKKSTPDPILTAFEGLSPETARAVIEHRRAKRSPLTLRAAQLLAKGFMATGDPEAAAEMMIVRGWTGFKLEWFQQEKSGHVNGKQSVQAAARSLVERSVDFGPVPKPYMPGRGGGETVGDPARLLSQGGRGGAGDLRDGSGRGPRQLSAGGGLPGDGPTLWPAGEEPVASDGGGGAGGVRSGNGPGSR